MSGVTGRLPGLPLNTENVLFLMSLGQSELIVIAPACLRKVNSKRVSEYLSFSGSRSGRNERRRFMKRVSNSLRGLWAN